MPVKLTQCPRKLRVVQNDFPLRVESGGMDTYNQMQAKS